jgi:internalin A
MRDYWHAYNEWNSDPAAALDEAERRIAACAEAKAERLYLGDIKLDRFPLGISALTWLNELDVYGSPIADFSPIAPLVDLRKLKAGSFGAPSPRLDFVRDWVELRSLDLIAPTPIDVAPLAVCERLERLHISCTQYPVDLHHLETLAALRSVTDLELYNMQPDRFDILGQWHALASVDLGRANLTTLAGFENLTQLAGLNIRDTSVADLSPLAGLQQLRGLNIARTKVRSLSPLAGLPRLARLSLAGTDVRDLSPLASVPALEELDVSDSSISDLSPLAELASLQRAQAEGAAKPGDVPGLRDIDLSRCPVESLEPLSRSPRLKRIDLSETRVTSLEPLHGIETLDSLTINGAPVRDMGAPGVFARIGFLYARDSALTNLRALEPAPGLQAIDISNTPVSDLRPLRAACNCRTMMLRGTQVKNLAPIIETGSREEDHRYSAQKLDFRNTPAADDSPRLAELAAIADTDMHKCFVETKRYLEAQAAARRPAKRWLARLLRAD